MIEIFIEDKLWLLRIIIRTLLNSQNGNHVLKPVRVEQEKKSINILLALISLQIPTSGLSSKQLLPNHLNSKVIIGDPKL